MEGINKWKQECRMRNVKRLGGEGFSGGRMPKRVDLGYDEERDEEERRLREQLALQRAENERLMRQRMRQLIPDQQAIIRNPFLQIPNIQQPPPPPRRRRPVAARPVGNAAQRLDFGRNDDEDDDEDMEGEGNIIGKKDKKEEIYEDDTEPEKLAKFIRNNADEMTTPELQQITKTYINMIKDFKENKRRDLLLEMLDKGNIPRVIEDLIISYL